MDDAPLKLRTYAEDGDGRMFMRRPVPSRLRGLVDTIVAYDEGGVPLVASAEFAPLLFPVVFSFGEPFEIALGRHPQPHERWGSFTAGLFPGCVLINSTGRSRCIQVDLTPPGACRLFDLPLSELANRMVLLDELADPEIHLLLRRLHDLDDWESRLVLVEDWLAERLLPANPPAVEIETAWNALLSSGGRIRIGDLADRVGWSRKHLVHRFRQEIGLEPKMVARMARFHRAVSFARGLGANRLADIAHECGYADQPHFTREFVQFTGLTPGAWRTSLGKA